MFEPWPVPEWLTALFQDSSRMDTMAGIMQGQATTLKQRVRSYKGVVKVPPDYRSLRPILFSSKSHSLTKWKWRRQWGVVRPSGRSSEPKIKISAGLHWAKILQRQKLSEKLARRQSRWEAPKLKVYNHSRISLPPRNDPGKFSASGPTKFFFIWSMKIPVIKSCCSLIGTVKRGADHIMS